jgi:hypothetical protein
VTVQTALQTRQGVVSIVSYGPIGAVSWLVFGPHWHQAPRNPSLWDCTGAISGKRLAASVRGRLRTLCPATD